MSRAAYIYAWESIVLVKTTSRSNRPKNSVWRERVSWCLAIVKTRTIRVYKYIKCVENPAVAKKINYMYIYIIYRPLTIYISLTLYIWWLWFFVWRPSYSMGINIIIIILWSCIYIIYIYMRRLLPVFFFIFFVWNSVLAGLDQRSCVCWIVTKKIELFVFAPNVVHNKLQ